VIWAGSAPGFFATALSLRPLVFLGLISYSLYLWHWPLIVFTRLETGGVLSHPQQAALATVCVILSIGTWWFVERPFRRRGPGGFSSRAIFAGGGVGIATVATAGIAVIGLHGLPQRFPKEVLAIVAASKDISPWRAKCHFVGRLRRTFDDTCAIGAAVAPTVIVYGDSHGDELAAALASFAKPRGASIRQITANTCPPAAGYAKLTRPQCATYNAAILKRLLSIPPATIILASNAVAWNGLPSYWRGMAETIAALRGAGHKVIVMGPVPAHPGGIRVPQTLARWVLNGKNPSAYTFDPSMKAFLSVQARLKDVAVAEQATFVPVAPIFCDSIVCHPYLDGTVLYSDDNHPSLAGEMLFAERLLVPLLWPTSQLSQMDGARAVR
jgi:lysophospholipase L1-like esterase